jgi:single-strand DNA-binding protein
MSTTITGKLNKAANQFQAGDSTGFSVRLGVKYRDPKTKQDEWTNYQAVIFAKAPGQIQFYQNALIEGAVIEVTCEQLKIDSYDGTNGTMLSIDMLNARLGYVFSGTQQPQQQAAPQQYQQQAPQQVPQQQYQQQPAPQQAPQYVDANGNPLSPQQVQQYSQGVQQVGK